MFLCVCTKPNGGRGERGSKQTCNKMKSISSQAGTWQTWITDASLGNLGPVRSPHGVIMASWVGNMEVMQCNPFSSPAPPSHSMQPLPTTLSWRIWFPQPSAEGPPVWGPPPPASLPTPLHLVEMRELPVPQPYLPGRGWDGGLGALFVIKFSWHRLSETLFLLWFTAKSAFCFPVWGCYDIRFFWLKKKMLTRSFFTQALWESPKAHMDLTASINPQEAQKGIALAKPLLLEPICKRQKTILHSLDSSLWVLVPFQIPHPSPLPALSQQAQNTCRTDFPIFSRDSICWLLQGEWGDA